MNKTKIKINKNTFYGILLVCLIIIICLVIDTVIGSLSTSRLNKFMDDHNYTRGDSSGEAHYRLIIIVRMIVNTIVFVFFALYSYYSYTRKENGYLFPLFWGFIMIGNILSAWFVPGADLWYKVVATIVSATGVIVLFQHFVILHQYRFYKANEKRWG